MWKEFKKFAFKGNILDMAVGVMIGGAFSKIVTSVVNDLFMPVISLFTGKMDFSSMFIALDGNSYTSLAQAQEAGAATFNYGAFLSSVVDFLLMALCVFFFVKLIAKLRRPEEKPPEPKKRTCPYCCLEIADEATRCPHCTAELEAAAKEG